MCVITEVEAIPVTKFIEDLVENIQLGFTEPVRINMSIWMIESYFMVKSFGYLLFPRCTLVVRLVDYLVGPT